MRRWRVGVRASCVRGGYLADRDDQPGAVGGGSCDERSDRMVTRLLAVLGWLFLCAFCVVWPPGAFLLSGVSLIWLAAVRRGNEAKAVSSGHPRPPAR